MILGISSFTYGWAVGMNPDNPKVTEFELLDRAVAYDLKCLQVGDNLPLHRLTESKLQELKIRIEKNHTRLEVGARKLTEDHLHRYLEISKFLKAPLLRFVVDSDNYQPSDQTIISILKNIVPELKENNITLGIENHDRFKARELAAIMDAVGDDRVGICLDSVNSIGAGEGLEWVTELLAPYTVNLHIKDFQIQRFQHKMGFIVTGVPAGRGMMDVSTIIHRLSQFGRCQSAILEQWAPPEATADLTIEKENLWADQGIKYLKGLTYFRTN
jgi:sugar phosphate isomerase/epimerase